MTTAAPSNKADTAKLAHDAADGQARSIGDAFRGRFIDKCAAMEGYAIEALRKYNAVDGKGVKKMPHLFGQKLAALRKLAEGDDPPFKDPTKLVELLDRFAGYAGLRSSLAHSVMSIATGSDGTYFLFENKSMPSLPDWQNRVVFTQAELVAILKDLSDLTNQLRQRL